MVARSQPARAQAHTRILVIDDERTVGDLIRAVLQRHGYAVDTSRGGEEALALASAGDYQLVISDFAIPGLTGLEFARRFLDVKPTVGVLIVSAFLDSDAMKELRALPNVVGVVRKPFDIFDLAERVGAALGA